MKLQAQVREGDKVIVDKGTTTESEAVVIKAYVATAQVQNDAGQTWWIMQSRLTIILE